MKFEKLRYSVQDQNGRLKPILNGISGEFRSGELIAVVGASGSGKTTLLNILTGYIKKNVEGTISIDGIKCSAKFLRNSATYVMQDVLLQPLLTVEEQMTFAINLKLSNSPTEKRSIVDKILNTLELQSCSSSTLEQLSGGEKKRLAIGLELIDNPSVIFLDEPTSGLDSVTVNLCVRIFRKLADEKRTVICSIHQPSVHTMNQFHQHYFLARGTCVYNGSTDQMLSFLSSVNLICPSTYSYSEFVIETTETKPETIALLSAAIDNGGINLRIAQEQPQTNQKIDTKTRPTFWSQFTVISRRMILQQLRNRVGLIVRIFTHVLVGLILGMAFFGVGETADTLLANIFFSYVCLLFFLYDSLMRNVTVFPLELEILKREYLNRWYEFNAYYLALSLRALPTMLSLGTGTILIGYFMSGQPQEIDRVFRFVLACLSISVTSEAFGIVIGSWLSILSGSLLGASIIAPLAMIPLYGFGFGGSLGWWTKNLMKLSYMRFGFIATVYALMENREVLECMDEFCYYKDPVHLIRDIGGLNSSYYWEIFGLLGYAVLFRALGYVVLKYRLKEEMSGQHSDFVAQILKLQK